MTSSNEKTILVAVAVIAAACFAPIEQARAGEILTNKESPPAMRELVACITAICDDHKIPFFLFGGSLIGAFRDHEFLPWDSDVDIGYDIANATMWDDVFVKQDFHQLKKKYPQCRNVIAFVKFDTKPFVGYRMYHHDDHRTFHNPNPPNPNDMNMTLLAYYHYFADIEARGPSKRIDRYEYAADTIYPLQRCKIHDINTWCPHDPAQMLTQLYDQNWKKPAYDHWDEKKGRWENSKHVHWDDKNQVWAPDTPDDEAAPVQNHKQGHGKHGGHKPKTPSERQEQERERRYQQEETMRNMKMNYDDRGVVYPSGGGGDGGDDDMSSNTPDDDWTDRGGRSSSSSSSGSSSGDDESSSGSVALDGDKRGAGQAALAVTGTALQPVM
eukprot:TRINITY_DN65862_c10_g1_i1.p1 TRINITY_DN65862_c10_g1~~TRINITY_DN65862_c10_g1_i1.p1  ORF type:complete len:384 (+),score=196.12 TRINITY_DN65862_c10_g1_i1:47-1198(+)